MDTSKKAARIIYFLIADKVLPFAFISVIIVITVFSEHWQHTLILGLVFLAWNIAISRIAKTADETRYNFWNITRCIVTAGLCIVIVIETGPNNPGWLACLPMMVGTPYTFKIKSYVYALTSLNIICTVGAMVFVHTDTVNIVTAIACLGFLAYTGTVAIDIIRKMEGRLRASEDALIAKNREILTFTDAVTHDLKKPLTVMKTICALFASEAMGELDKDRREAVETGKNSIEYMQEMLNDLLACSRLESGAQALQRERVPVNEVVDHVLGHLKYQIKEKKIQVRTRGLECSIPADRKLLHQIFMNLVGNAVSYIGDGPDRRIDISSITESSCVRFQVRDNGMGIPDDTKPFLFEKFKRGTNTSGIQGSGLGLAIVKAAVEIHGGTIRVESVVGKGTTFNITIPAGKRSPEKS